MLQVGVAWGALKIVLQLEKRITSALLLGFQVVEMVTIQLGEMMPHLGREVLGLAHDVVLIDDREAGIYNVLKFLVRAPQIAKVK